uniref:hypothetical protein n=1 Tax=uncultured Draconibacterium sp. TaxID=1573823 RepID=UPI003216404E
MGTIIKSIAINNSAEEQGIVELVSETSNRCLGKAGVPFNAVGMLINTSVYNENYLLEPALATVIQKRLSGNGTQENQENEAIKSVLSFDLHNGGGGLINAVQVMDGFISSGEIEYGLIVSGDVKPGIGLVENYSYSTSAGAVLVSKGKKGEGFLKFRTETFAEFKDDLTSTVSWEKEQVHFVNKTSNDYLKNAVHCSVDLLQRFLSEEQLSWNDIDLICTSQSPTGFASAFQKKLNIENKIVYLNNQMEIYSSGLLYSVNHIFESEKMMNAKHILFLTVGAGITVSLAYYKIN